MCDQVDPFLSVKTPRRELVSFSGSALYNQDKIIKGNMALNLLNFKPASVQCESPTLTLQSRTFVIKNVESVWRINLFGMCRLFVFDMGW